jgi:hypothetical protein
MAYSSHSTPAPDGIIRKITGFRKSYPSKAAGREESYFHSPACRLMGGSCGSALPDRSVLVTRAGLRRLGMMGHHRALLSARWDGIHPAIFKQRADRDNVIPEVQYTTHETRPYLRLVRGDYVTTDKVRLRATQSPVCTALAEFGFYAEPATAQSKNR